MKKIVILQHGGGELANQLWNHMSIYAYALSEKVICENYSFFEYAHFFSLPMQNKGISFFFFKPFRYHTARRNAFRTRCFRALYKIYILFIQTVHPGAVISSKNVANVPVYLPSSQQADARIKTASLPSVLYFDGWLFRNPKGIEIYHNEIIRHFAPIETIRRKVDSVIIPLRKQFAHVVGVHIRQGDYKFFKNGKYFLKISRVVEVLREYLAEKKWRNEETVFVVASDGAINDADFSDINIARTDGNAAEDLFTLAATDTIIGSDSSYGNIAAYFGNIPHIVITKNSIDWRYYRAKNTYFPTKYCTMVHY